MNKLSYRLPPELTTAVEAALADWQQHDKVRHLWDKDATLWTGSDEARWLDWLTAPAEQLEQIADLQVFAVEIRDSGLRDVVLLGMGGSSMAPEVLRETFGAAAGYPDLKVVDSTDPAQVRSVEQAVDLAHTLFIVASKSGSTLEPNILKAYFYQRMVETVGASQAPAHFVAITDPGSDLENAAGVEGFRRIFHGKPEIGGRFSALSSFGLVPAALLGVDLQRFMGSTLEMVAACSPDMAVADNPGVVLGAILGSAANQGRDKLTLAASPGVSSIGAWLEQLVAESTGKQGKAIIPLDGESVEVPEAYGEDRLFVYLQLEGAADVNQDQAVARLEQAGQPVVRIGIEDIYNLGQEWFRWEIATAVSGALMGINPFDQPDVEASKIETRKLTTAYEVDGSLPEETPLVEGEGLALYTDAENAAALKAIAGEQATVADYIAAHLGRIEAGDYLALLAYLPRNEIHDYPLQAMRHLIRAAWKVATCVGFGPRFLHSTGQAYKGGPNTGVFLQITCEDASDLAVPGHDYTFGVVKAAQARGDFEVLAERRRRVLRAHLGKDTVQGLQQLWRLVEKAAANT
jgi:glucose-6-phosphate isomerase